MMTQSSFNAKEFVDRLVTIGDDIPCDDTVEFFNRDGKLPDFYNEEKFKRGQRFYHENILAMFFAKMLGLVMSLALPKVNSILRFTKMSSDPELAYKRYLSTVYHMRIWYDEDFYPGSKIWQSISAVKCKHNTASKRGCVAGLGRISQKDMALAQFSFMGLAVIRNDMVGIYWGKDVDMEAFVHLWRVIGYVFGMDDRFNICRENLHETKAICEHIMLDVFKPEVIKMDKDFLQMASALINGMWCMNPVLEIKVFLSYILTILGVLNGIDLDVWGRFKFKFVCLTLYSLKFSLIRWYHNNVQYLAIWLMENFPFLAFYKFGIKKSYVEIMFPKT